MSNTQRSSYGVLLLALACAPTAFAQAQSTAPSSPQQQAPAEQARPGRPSGPVQQRIAPGLAALTDDVLFGDVWVRPGLSPRDRSLVTISVLIATGKPAQLEGHLGRALNNGVLPTEASGVLAHLAIYSGWPNAVSALDVYDRVYAARKVDTASLAVAVSPVPAAASDPARAREVNEQFAGLAPKFAQLTNDVVFDGLWRRGDLALRDRSLVTIAALAGMGDDDQLDPYLRRGMESGLTREQIAEAFTHLGFYAGWSRATKAMTAMAKSLGPAQAQPSRPEPSTPPQASGNFTGTVSVGASFRGSGGSRLGGAPVTFQAGARTYWHTHPLGQLLVVTTGHGWMQIEGESVRAIGPGDVVWTPPGAKHWHGATPSGAMTHVAISESEPGRAVTWLEPVSDAQYKGLRE
jgi:4-carboxymuconolactone decarboxylase